ncbi:putative rRNA methylase [Desulfofarcimen acetoxidans DSM 771]|jgi:16S rRNA C1402 N4-methylase RsmH|uniref:Putative rRNA methylase n=1 Tax=Desulfofarcimen acetoxidans (strain ATCC 49208 / DSM 771 / KCTC 5769 / VKM B-1644 / 5575) TaxID=485916 RepID=C8W0X8_DESAS|nr:class I SAM-dependent methyltransferase [Desulfofarcimen acetoxidans]ACV63374.1 putative rRNA methylase [Desulfofarcimen acetoxidans DSM 771]
MFNSWRRAVSIAQIFIGEILFDGSVAIDATVGTGEDTLFLASSVGPSGQIFAFDIQEQAIAAAEQKIKQRHLDKRVKFYLASHEALVSLVKVKVNAVMFNLGYLPGGDHSIITKAESTLAALCQSMELLLPGGRISIVLYTGHEGSLEECTAVEKYVSKLDNKLYNVIKLNFYNRKNPSPFLILIEKEGPRSEKQAAEIDSGYSQPADY